VSRENSTPTKKTRIRKIVEEMGDLLEADEPFVFEEKKGKTVKKKKPRIDETLYDL